jgi:DNA excision repair protein ERCC-6
MNDPESLAADAEAARVAARAAEALRRSREECMRAPVNAPTWTGRSGATGAPPQALDRRQPAAAAPHPGATGAGARRPRFGAVATATGARSAGGEAAGSSAALLNQLRARQQSLAAGGVPPRDSPEASGARAGGGSSGRGGGGAPSPEPDIDSQAAQQLAAHIVQYLDRQCGAEREAPSTALVAAFRSQVADANLHLFSQLLGQVRS